MAAAGAHSAAAGAAPAGDGAPATGGGGASATSAGAPSAGATSAGATSAGAANGGASSGGATGGGATSNGGGGGTPPSGGSGGTSASGGSSAAAGGSGGATLTLAQACAKNCTLAAGLTGCSTTNDVCVQSCLTTFDNTSNVNATLGREYTTMMVCIATDTAEFGTADKFQCAKPDRALNKWSPGPDSKCEGAICQWNCNDGTTGNFDPFVDIRCSCSSV